MGVFTERAAAEEFIQGDPFVLNGVADKWSLRDWNEVLAQDGMPIPVGASQVEYIEVAA